MAFMLRTARPVVARSFTVARAQTRNMTQNSLEAQRYSFKHAIEDIRGECCFCASPLLLGRRLVVSSYCPVAAVAQQPPATRSARA